MAGERARADNFVYGSTKAGLDAFTQGLGDRLVGIGRLGHGGPPGFVRTSMTEGMEDGPMATTAEAVAKDIVAGLRRGAHTVWSPAKLRLRVRRAQGAAPPGVAQARRTSADRTARQNRRP